MTKEQVITLLLQGGTVVIPIGVDNWIPRCLTITGYLNNGETFIARDDYNYECLARFKDDGKIEYWYKNPPQTWRYNYLPS